MVPVEAEGVLEDLKALPLPERNVRIEIHAASQCM
jgi:hypothetical protein